MFLWYFGLYCVFTECNLWKSPFYCRYNAEFSFGTNKNLIFLDYFWQILLVIFAKSCMPAVHSAESDKG
jgi:hypothetical protein